MNKKSLGYLQGLFKIDLIYARVASLSLNCLIELI